MPYFTVPYFTMRGPALMAALLAASPLAAQAQPQPPPTDRDIVVSGTRNAPEKIERFASDLSISDAASPLPLYEPGQFCPGVVGLSPQRNREIAERMRQVARTAGMQPAEGACRTSALVLFADDRAELLKQFRLLHPEYFSELTGEAIAFHGDNEPVMAWKLLARIDRNGNPVAIDDSGIQIVEVTVGVSRLQSATRPVIAMSVVLIERAAVRGLTGVQIADYALMRSVTDKAPKSLRADPMATILKVIDTPIGAPTPVTLTAWDLAYARSRYEVNRWNYGPTQMASIRSDMKQALGDGS